ncbi:hypothetical protein PSTG_09504 [Puccinia striiformis f. sp. tritici PST-78]|uniref:Uncharacterized protein n=1 Tax=Puccinia striiformis f. sp. tritici PST-78 TaxID=1165861 RepID=A0A0L0VDH1_9BASI|nr:hypothetical protein PSTG_09504 [Puccinia striiformis f. sp. tritici PST-78]
MSKQPAGGMICSDSRVRPLVGRPRNCSDMYAGLTTRRTTSLSEQTNHAHSSSCFFQVCSGKPLHRGYAKRPSGGTLLSHGIRKEFSRTVQGYEQLSDRRATDESMKTNQSHSMANRQTQSEGHF